MKKMLEFKQVAIKWQQKQTEDYIAKDQEELFTPILYLLSGDDKPIPIWVWVQNGYIKPNEFTIDNTVLYGRNNKGK